LRQPEDLESEASLVTEWYPISKQNQKEKQNKNQPNNNKKATQTNKM
jgi:hypothetical protein